LSIFALCPDRPPDPRLLLEAITAPEGDDMTETWNWRIAARCRVADADTLFTRGRVQREVRQFCTTCPVRTECLAHALDHQIEIGIWGGMTERQRRALLKQRPQVTSWTQLLESARRAHYAALADAAATAAPGTPGTPGTQPDAAEPARGTAAA
jgi:WhiB family redox-sensing transcriptional regulator